MSMNILVTAVGSYSGRSVINSLKNNGGNVVVGCDIHQGNWLDISSKLDHFYQVKPYKEAGYLQQIKEIIESHKIDLIIPLIDPEVDIYSENRQFLEGETCKLAISNHQSILTCRNKYQLFNFFKNDCQVTVIPTYIFDNLPKENLPEKLIGKPLKGRSSKGYIQLNRDALLNMAKDLKNYVFQPFIDGNVFSIDCIRDKQKNFICIARQELIRTSHGAGITVEIISNDDLEMISELILSKLNYSGFANIEFLYDGNEYYLMDINPRFSAGVGFSILSGYDMVTNLVNSFYGKPISETKSIEYGIYSKVMQEVKL
jgi:carbamoyl-phosphate synthase large subunit